MTSTQPFDEPYARWVLRHACVDLGIGVAEADDSVLLGLSENAVFALPNSPVIAKVARDASVFERADRALRVAEWLALHQVPAVRPAADLPARAVLVEDHPVTFWQRLEEPTRPPNPADLAPLLKQLHALGRPPFPLPRREVLGNVERWLAQAEGHIDPKDADFLRRRRGELRAATEELTPALPPGPIHGDALPRNVHVGSAGPMLVDLETAADDLREHDLVVLSLSHDRYGLPEADYQAFLDGYGFDVADWDGHLVLRGARETASAAWVAQQAPGNPRARAEFEHRVASLRSGDTEARWHAF